MSEMPVLLARLQPFLAHLRAATLPKTALRETTLRGTTLRETTPPGAPAMPAPTSAQTPAPIRLAEQPPATAASWVNGLEKLAAQRLDAGAHGDLPHWIEVLEALPDLPADERMLNQDAVGVRAQRPLTAAEHRAMETGLMALHPWRKGPFLLHGMALDAEWRSDRKWARLATGITPLEGRLVLDLGCGNGWYGYRMLGAGARLVLGIDPTLRFVAQFLAINHFIGEDRLGVLPMTDDELVARAPKGRFDSLFSMGVLYHRRDPHRHLAGLRQLLRPGGELVLETLVLDAPGSRVLHPPGRYAQMRNVHALPTIDALRDWLTDAGFRRLELLDVSRTTTQEQRATPWMRFHSLADFLDPEHPDLTREGHPAPTRALLTAQT